MIGSGAIFNSSARISSGMYKESGSGRGSDRDDQNRLIKGDLITQMNSESSSLKFS